MSKSNEGTIRIRWIRSGIAFDRRQKEIVRSLGLRRLHQIVERVDTPTVRGLVAKAAHLVEIVDGKKQRIRPSVPEYTIVQNGVAEVGAPESGAAPATVREPESLENERAEA